MVEESAAEVEVEELVALGRITCNLALFNSKVTPYNTIPA